MADTLPAHRPIPQPVAHAWLSDQPLRTRRIAFDFLAQFRHVNPHVVRLLLCAVAPDFLQNLAVREHFAGVARKQRQQFVLNRREMHRLTVARHFTAGEVDTQTTEVELLFNWRCARVAKGDAHARK